MKNSDLIFSRKAPYYWAKFAATSLLAAVMAGCGGGSDEAPGAPVPPVAEVLPSVAVPTGTAAVTASKLTATQFADLTPIITVGGVVINSPPKVTFAVSDGPANNPIIGVGFTNQSGTTKFAGLANLSFSLAKLVPGSNGSPSKWVSYIVTTVPTYKSATAADKEGASNINVSVPTRPGTDNTGNLIDNGNGTYTYTFYRDITKVKSEVEAAALSSPNVASDLGDLTYDPNLPHRLTIQMSGNARGTGTNTADGSNSGVTAVPMKNPVNVVYDFIPATGKAIAAADLQREVVALASCNGCHEKLAIHGGSGRVDTRYCVVCHTDQRKYGRTPTASTVDSVSKAIKLPALKETASVNSTTGITSYSYSPSTYVADGQVLGDFTNVIHKMHQGNRLVKENYNYANAVFNNKGYSMLAGGQKMCSTCHDKAKALQADNWNLKPSRLGCGSCHDGIDFATGLGSTLKEKATFAAASAAKIAAGNVTLARSGHRPGPLPATDATCSTCHTPELIKSKHWTTDVTKNNPTIAAGLKNVAYEITSATVNSTTNDLTINFKILVDGSPVTTLVTGGAPVPGFTGSPGFLLAYALPLDNIATPADYRIDTKQSQPLSINVSALTGFSGVNGSLPLAAANGIFTATIKGTATATCGTPSRACLFPVGAKMRTVGLQGQMTQVADVNLGLAATARPTVSVTKTVTGDTERRKVVDPAKCANCHELLKLHGGSRVYETQVCVMCHLPGMASSGRGIAAANLTIWSSTALTTSFTAPELVTLRDWLGTVPTNWTDADVLKLPVANMGFKDMIHGYHSGRDRVTPFMTMRDRGSLNTSGVITGGGLTPRDFRRLDFPGELNNCETCHIPGTYSNVPTNALASTNESVNVAGNTTTVLARAALDQPNDTDKVTSPYASACIGCHNSVPALSHIANSGGGKIDVSRSVFKAGVLTSGGGEGCAVCHGTGKGEDVAVVHKK